MSAGESPSVQKNQAQGPPDAFIALQFVLISFGSFRLMFGDNFFFTPLYSESVWCYIWRKFLHIFTILK
jgi:hypothetical protein